MACDHRNVIVEPGDADREFCRDCGAVRCPETTGIWTPALEAARRSEPVRRAVYLHCLREAHRYRGTFAPEKKP